MSHRVGLDGPRNSRTHRGLIPGPSTVASPYTDCAMPDYWRNGAERRGEERREVRLVEVFPLPFVHTKVYKDWPDLEV